ncbi:small, acid-soluble spore protein, H family [Paenibacillus silvae]|nr:small, acid-soluble spore protein, H family [Paenibacillus silvae]MCK6078198.1 small, acid-soluble spore protein, H family [Paenibacillus silvae]MCK6152540.1 small, acid-soluble spore protein, H family [Paenibacillus silvae]MCK6271065.1 small, acid-soluble spore protein, H family [Paenibacillus silvae]
MRNVIYQDAPIFIQHVNEDETARIYPIGNSEQEMTVPLSSLTEHP